MAMAMVQRPPAGPVTALLSKPVQAKVTFENMSGDLNPLHATHLANMPVFYQRRLNTKDAYLEQRHPAIKAHVNMASPEFNNYYPTSRPYDSKGEFNGNPQNGKQLLFLGVTRDHLVDGKAALDHPDAAGRFTADAAGVVTILQPKEVLRNIPLGADLFWTQDRFQIGSKNVQSFKMTHVQIFNVKNDGSEDDGRHQNIAFGRLVEKRMGETCEARVLLYSNDTQSVRALEIPSKEFNAVEPIFDLGDRTMQQKKQRQPPVEKEATTGSNLGASATTTVAGVEGDMTSAPPKKKHKSKSKSSKSN
jgi:hypothetical protein